MYATSNVRTRRAVSMRVVSIPVILILLLAFALRIHLLGAQSLWNDEGNAYVQATRTFTDIAANAARDIHPPASSQ
jgi:predicted membrane-bound mannosyltransferase